jgi:hypothetical protein
MEAVSVATQNAKLERLFGHLQHPPTPATKQNQNMYRQNADTVFRLTTLDTPDTNCGDLRVALYRDLTYVL